MKDRTKVNDKYKWDLTKIYNDIDEFNSNFELVKEKISNLSKYKDTIIDNANTLYETIILSYEIERILDKLSVYTSLLCDIDTSNNTNQELKGKVSNLYDEYTTASYFIVPSILKLDKHKLNDYYRKNEKLLNYKIVIDRINRYKNHTLSDKEEKLLSSINKIIGNNYDTYELLKDCDLSFDKIKVGSKRVEIDNSNYSLYMESANRSIRKDAFTTLYKKYRQYKNTFAKILESNIKEEVTLAKIRNYNSALESSLYNDEIPSSVYNNLISSVNDNLNILYKYYDLKKKVLNLDELHIYDVYAPLVKEIKTKYSYEVAKKNVINALQIMGSDYVNKIKEALNNRWIDVYPSKGKRTGGYSGGSYDTAPYILLNYQDKYDDMSTLIHELGHSMHSYYTRSNNDYQYGDYSIFVAEVASTVNELLLSKYMLKVSNSKEEKKFILNRMLETFRATVYRQTMFSEFERDVYNLLEQDIPLTSDKLCEVYYDLNKKYFGDNVIIDEEIKYEWERIPHFYYNFYVYKYATGLSAAYYIVENVIEKGKVEDYLNFLKCGRKLNPIDSLKLAGVDLTNKNIIDSAIKSFNNIIEEFNNLS